MLRTLIDKFLSSFAGSANGSSESSRVGEYEDLAIGKPLQLPDDLFAQSESQTEWWYYTGHCLTESGKRFGFEFVFFRRRTDHDKLGIIPLRLLANPMYAAHFAITDIDNKTFIFRDRRGFAGPFSFDSDASGERFRLEIGDWKFGGDEVRQFLNASIDGDLRFETVLKRLKAPALNGHGGPESKHNLATSKHFSFTRMSLEGVLETKGTSESFSGTAWMDREYGTWFQRHWDWFSIQLEDESELMLYLFRDSSGNATSRSHGNFVDRHGKCRKLKFEEFLTTRKKTWRSPHTGVEYPAGWIVEVPCLKIELEVDPFVEDQELNTSKSTMIVYWEGACGVKGKTGNTDITGNAYVELVGYDSGRYRPTFFKFLKGFI